jgi:hypothetical protein
VAAGAREQLRFHGFATGTRVQVVSIQRGSHHATKQSTQNETDGSSRVRETSTVRRVNLP